MKTTMSLEEIKQKDTDLHQVFSCPPFDDAGNQIHVINDDGLVDIRLVSKLYRGSWITEQFARLLGGEIMEPIEAMEKLRKEREAADQEMERLLATRQKATREHYDDNLQSYLIHLANI